MQWIVQCRVQRQDLSLLKLCWIPSSDIWTQDESRVHQDLQVIWRTGGGRRVCHFDNLVEGRHFINQAPAWVSIVFAHYCFTAKYLATSFWEASPSLCQCSAKVIQKLSPGSAKDIPSHHQWCPVKPIRYPWGQQIQSSDYLALSCNILHYLALSYTMLQWCPVVPKRYTCSQQMSPVIAFI